MTWDIAVAGTLHIDDITTPHGHQSEVCGGSAVYFALAASHHAPLHVHGIVGSDAAADFSRILGSDNITQAGIVISPRPTFRWHAVHDYQRWVAVEIAAEQGCDPDWTARLTTDGAIAPVLFVGSMRPQLQLDILGQSSARLIGSDTMTTFISSERDTVMAVVEASDILFVNRDELQTLLPQFEGRWTEAAQSLLGNGRLRAVVVKAGPSGAACVTAAGVLARPAAPVAAVLDPTGAGDCLAGGFLGLCAAAERDDDAFFEDALDEGLRCAAAGIAAFGTDAIRGLASTRVPPASASG